MILQSVDFIQVIADIVAAILNTLNLFVRPLGLFMISWMEYVLQFFPRNNLTVYIIIAIVIVILGLIVNIIWPGNKKPGFLVKAEEVEEKIEKKAKKLDQKVEDKAKELDEKVEELEGPAQELEEKSEDWWDSAEKPEEITEDLEEAVEELDEEAEELVEAAKDLKEKTEDD
jgi:methyl-accepting chemotaxis protein